MPSHRKSVWFGEYSHTDADKKDEMVTKVTGEGAFRCAATGQAGIDLPVFEIVARKTRYMTQGAVICPPLVKLAP